jgi:hypothetical protein
MQGEKGKTGIEISWARTLYTKRNASMKYPIGALNEILSLEKSTDDGSKKLRW